MFNIDVGGSLSLNLMLGKIEASGSFKYIEEKKVKSRYYKEQVQKITYICRILDLKMLQC